MPATSQTEFNYRRPMIGRIEDQSIHSVWDCSLALSLAIN